MVHASSLIGGSVAYTKSGCDYYIVSDKNGYDLLEWYGGAFPVVGYVLAGEINSYGFKDIYIGSSASTITKGRAWVEDYRLSAESVVNKFRDKCHMNNTTYSYGTYTPNTYTSTYYPTYTSTYSSSNLSNSNYYTNTNGNTVHSPAYSNSVPSSASAQCNDGTYSFSQSRSGTCSRHGGVASWY